MKSALQLQLEDLNGLPFIAGIIWFALLGICLLAIILYFLRKKNNPKQSQNLDSLEKKESKPRGF